MSSFAGPFGQLPVLEWPDTERDELVTVVQTLAIAQFLSLKLDPVFKTLGPTAIVVTKAMTYGCCAYEDLLLKIFGAVYNPALAVEVFGVKVPKILERFDELLSVMQENTTELALSTGQPISSAKEYYLLGPVPAWPDYVLFYATLLIAKIAGPELLQNFPQMEAYVQRMAQRPNLAAYFASGKEAAPYTGCPNEEENLIEIQKALQQVGLLPPADES